MSYRVRFEDWIWALHKRRILNRSYIQKFGFDVAEITIFMERRESMEPREPGSASGE